MIALDFWEKWRPVSAVVSVGLRVCAMKHSSVYICLKLKKKKMSRFENERGRESDKFSLKFWSKVTGVLFFPLSQTLGYIFCIIPKNESLTWRVSNLQRKELFLWRITRWGLKNFDPCEGQAESVFTSVLFYIFLWGNFTSVFLFYPHHNSVKWERQILHSSFYRWESGVH